MNDKQPRNDGDYALLVAAVREYRWLRYREAHRNFQMLTIEEQSRMNECEALLNRLVGCVLGDPGRAVMLERSPADQPSEPCISRES